MAQITNDRAADRPRLRLIAGGQAAAVHREEQKRRAELQQFIKACEALYEKNHFKYLGQLCQFFHRFLGVMQQGVTHFWRTAGIKHFHLIDTLILQRNIWIYKRI